MAHYELTCPQCGHQYHVRYPYCSRGSDDPAVHERYAAQARGEVEPARCSFCRDFDRMQTRRVGQSPRDWYLDITRKLNSIENLQYALTAMSTTGFEYWLRSFDVVAAAEPLGDYRSLPHPAAQAVLEWRGEEYPQRWTDHFEANRRAFANMFQPVSRADANRTYRVQPLNPNDLPRDEGAYTPWNQSRVHRPQSL